MNTAQISEQLELLPNFLGNHLLLTVLAIMIGIIVCIPLGIIVTRIKKIETTVLSVVGILQTIPGIALLALMVSLIGEIGFLPALIALVIYSFLPILRNTVTGINGVDKDIVEAAIGIGMTDKQLLFKVQLPLALPVIIAGIRTASVWVIGTATLATPVGATSLGNYIFSGLQTQNITAITIGCIAAALLAIIVDQIIYITELAISKRKQIYAIPAVVGGLLLIVSSLFMFIDPSDENRFTVDIGSKPFTEQYILAGYLDKTLSDLQIQTELHTGMGTMILFEALKNSDIDLYIDYTGTIWTNVLKRSDIPSKEQILKELSEYLNDKFGIMTIGTVGFENTYALVVKQEFADSLNIKSISDLQKYAAELSIGSDYEFFTRPEWLSIEEEYNLTFKEEITLDPTLMYNAIANDEVDVISAYSTDGRIAAYNLFALNDPFQALPPYDAVILISPELAMQEAIVKKLKMFVNTIDNTEMRNANKIVDIDKKSINDAINYLKNRKSQDN